MLFSEYCFGNGKNKGSPLGGPWFCQDPAVLRVSQWWMSVFYFRFLSYASNISVTTTRGFQFRGKPSSSGESVFG